jgi:hypothetical protein
VLYVVQRDVTVTVTNVALSATGSGTYAPSDYDTGLSWTGFSFRTFAGPSITDTDGDEVNEFAFPSAANWW